MLPHSMKRLFRHPVGLVAIAHALSWAVAVFTRAHLVSIGDEGNWGSVFILGSPILWTAIAILELLRSSPDRRVLLTMACITGVIAVLGSFTLGLLLVPTTVLLVLATAKLPSSDDLRY